MPDDAPTSTSDGASLDDLERRLASFENATKRLNRTVGGMADPEPTAAPGHTSPPRPATRRLSESGAPRGEEISGLRPAVQAQGPQTGALTARTRNIPGPQAGTPGFTSAYGRPNIGSSDAPAAANTSKVQTKAITRRPATWMLVVAGCAILLLLGLFLLPRQFPVLRNGTVWSPTETVTAPRAGQVDTLHAVAGAAVAEGQELARFADGGSVRAPAARTLVRFFITAGSRLVAGEPVAELADTSRSRVVVASSGTGSAGDRVLVRLLGENVELYGTVESFLGPETPGAWPSGSIPPPRLTIVVDPGGHVPRINQGVHVVVIGRSALNGALYLLRSVLPW